MDIFTFCIAVFGVLLNAFAQLSIKFGLKSVGVLSLKNGIFALLWQVIFNAGIFTGLALYVVSVGVWIYVLSKVEVSIAYPLLSIGYIVNLFLASLLFGEAITVQKLAGVGIIIIGVVVLTRGGAV